MSSLYHCMCVYVSVVLYNNVKSSLYMHVYVSTGTNILWRTQHISRIPAVVRDRRTSCPESCNHCVCARTRHMPDAPDSDFRNSEYSEMGFYQILQANGSLYRLHTVRYVMSAYLPHIITYMYNTYIVHSYVKKLDRFNHNLINTVYSVNRECCSFNFKNSYNYFITNFITISYKIANQLMKTIKKSVYHYFIWILLLKLMYLLIKK